MPPALPGRFLTTGLPGKSLKLAFNYKSKINLHEASHVAQWQSICLPVQEKQEIWVQFLGREDPLEEEMATHSSILAWRIPRTEEPGGL